jgi:hypothetical protein
MNLITLFLWIILSIPLLASYGSVIERNNDVGVGMPLGLKQFYGLTIILTLISVLFLISWSTNLETTPENMETIQLSIILIMSCSIAWGPLFNIGCGKNSLYRSMSILALIGVAVGVSVLLYTAYEEYSIDNNQTNLWAVITNSFFLFQTFILDAIVWSIYFLNN